LKFDPARAFIDHPSERTARISGGGVCCVAAPTDPEGFGWGMQPELAEGAAGV